MDAIKSAVKISLFVALLTILATVLQTFLGLFVHVVIPDIVWELAKVIDCFLPFDGQVFFMALGRALTGIGVFMLGYRMYVLKMDYTKHV